MEEQNKNVRGIVTRGVGGLYGVRTARDPGEEILCRARGILRQKKTAPTVGDDVLIELSEEKEPADQPAAEETPRGNRTDPRHRDPGRRDDGPAGAPWMAAMRTGEWTWTGSSTRWQSGAV